MPPAKKVVDMTKVEMRPWDYKTVMIFVLAGEHLNTIYADCFRYAGTLQACDKLDAFRERHSYSLHQAFRFLTQDSPFSRTAYLEMNESDKVLAKKTIDEHPEIFESYNNDWCISLLDELIHVDGDVSINVLKSEQY